MSSIDAKFDNSIFHKNHPIILSSNRVLASLLGIRLAYRAEGYEAGRVLGRNTTSGFYDRYDSGSSSGLDTAACVLMKDVDVTDFASTGDNQVAVGIFGGEVFKDKLTGLDSGAITDLGAKTIVDAAGVNILKY